VRPVIFDLDGVLIDSEPLYERAFATFLERVGRRDASNLFALTLGRREVDFLPIVAARLALPEQDVRRELQRATDALIGDLRPMPFATEVFATFHAEGRSLAIATSSLATFAEQAIRQLGIESMVRALASGEDVTEGKPDPSIYQIAASRIGVRPATCIAVEDTPAGVAAASAAGMTCIAIPGPLSARTDLAEADVIANDLRAAVRTIRRLDRWDS
jgi:mannitol-1-/sugar-/sorbitol-6-phosphatase